MLQRNQAGWGRPRQYFFQHWNNKSQLKFVGYSTGGKKQVNDTFEDRWQFRKKHGFKRQLGIGARSRFAADERIISDITSFLAGFNDPRIDITSVSSHWLSVLMIWHNPLRIVTFFWIKLSAKAQRGLALGQGWGVFALLDQTVNCCNRIDILMVVSLRCNVSKST